MFAGIHFWINCQVTHMTDPSPKILPISNRKKFSSRNRQQITKDLTLIELCIFLISGFSFVALSRFLKENEKSILSFLYFFNYLYKSARWVSRFWILLYSSFFAVQTCNSGPNSGTTRKVLQPRIFLDCLHIKIWLR